MEIGKDIELKRRKINFNVSDEMKAIIASFIIYIMVDS